MRVVKDRKMRKKKVSGTALEAFSYFFLQYRKPVLLNIQIEGFIDLLGYIFPVLFPLSDTFGQKVFDLSVDGTEVVFRPCGQGIVKLCRKPQRDLLFLSHERSFLSVEATGVHDRLGFLVAAQYDQKI